MSKQLRLTVTVETSDLSKIEEIIKEEYPKLKNKSEVVRVAIRGYYRDWKTAKEAI